MPTIGVGCSVNDVYSALKALLVGGQNMYTLHTAAHLRPRPSLRLTMSLWGPLRRNNCVGAGQERGRRVHHSLAISTFTEVQKKDVPIPGREADSATQLKSSHVETRVLPKGFLRS